MPFKAFLKIDGVDGQSPDDKHANWIEIHSYSHHLAQSGSFGKNGELTGGSVDVQEFTIVKELDKASPIITEKCCTGTNVNKVTLELVAAADKNHTFMKYELSPCIISGSSVGGAGGSEGGNRPMETVTFRFNIIKWEFTPYDNQRAGTAVRSGWDIGKGTKAS